MRFTQLQDWLTWIESCHPNEIELGLKRVATVAKQLGCSFPKTQVVTVAGTNGKGSCVAALTSVLKAAGLKSGCYTSPHFIDYNERIQIDGDNIDDQSLVDSFDRIDQARGDVQLTYFEYGTLAALDILSRANLDVVVLEVGLGGRLDAVNIIDADIAIVTSIAIDHEDWLGSDVEVIGYEKAGIFRADKLALCGDPTPPSSVEAHALECGAQFIQRGRDFEITQDGAGIVWSASGRSLSLPKLSLPLDSVAVAVQALELLDVGIPEEAYRSLIDVSLVGRFQQEKAEGKKIILDVAHNPAAASLLAANLTRDTCSGRTLVLAAVMADKDLSGLIGPLRDIVDAWFLADLKNNSRALSASQFANGLADMGIGMISVSKNVRQAYRRALSMMGPEDRLVVFGSFFTVAEVLPLLARDKQREGRDSE